MKPSPQACLVRNLQQFQIRHKLLWHGLCVSGMQLSCRGQFSNLSHFEGFV